MARILRINVINMENWLVESETGFFELKKMLKFVKDDKVGFLLSFLNKKKKTKHR